MVILGQQSTLLDGLLVAAAALLLLLFLLNLTRLVNMGQSRAVFLLVVLPFALIAALLLFRQTESIAEYTGEVVGGTLHLGGPAAVFALVLWAGWKFSASAGPFTVPVRLVVQSDAQRSITGHIVLRLPTGPIRAIIGEHETAVYTGVPREFARTEVPIDIRVPGYRVVSPGSMHLLIPNNTISVDIEPDSVSLVVQGRVLNAADGSPIPDARVDADAQSTMTDSGGWFRLTVVDGTESRPVQLVVTRAGFLAHSREVTARRSTDLEAGSITLKLERSSGLDT